MQMCKVVLNSQTLLTPCLVAAALGIASTQWKGKPRKYMKLLVNPVYQTPHLKTFTSFSLF